MKIEGNTPNGPFQPIDTTPSQASSGVRPSSEGTAQTLGGTSASASDTVTLSSAAQLAGRALQAANSTPALRMDRIAQAQQQLAAGQVGQDPMALADRLIDEALVG